MGELSRCLVTVLIVLPVALLLIGPSLVLAALRGTQRVGPIVFADRRSGWIGRVGIALLGLLLWAGLWGGLVVLVRPAVDH